MIRALVLGIVGAFLASTWLSRRGPTSARSYEQPGRAMSEEGAEQEIGSR